jgi:hypothetical protein
MKLVTGLLISFLTSALSAPALVWKHRRTAESIHHSSDNVEIKDILADVVPTDSDSLPAVVFLVGRSDDGSETLSTLTSGGALPQVASKYNDADSVFHHCSGLESASSITRQISKEKHSVMSVSLDEFNGKLAALEAPAEIEVEYEGNMVSKAQAYSTKRAKSIEGADVLVVDIPASANAAMIDSVVSGAISSSKVGNVVLAGLRSVTEIKFERKLLAHRKLQSMTLVHRSLDQNNRRLDNVQGDDANNNNGNNNDMSGVYYVSMTPNILAGILFFSLFAVTTWIGISCMGAITGPSVYPTKMPSVGREA